MTVLVSLKTELEEIVLNAVILAAPDVPADLLAARLYDDEPKLSAKLARELVLLHYAHLIRVARARENRKDADQLLLPGFEHLPARIAVAPGKRRFIEKARYTDLRAYFRLLNRKHRDHWRNNTKLGEVKKLMELMQKHSRETPWITVGEVMAREQGQR